VPFQAIPDSCLMLDSRELSQYILIPLVFVYIYSETCNAMAKGEHTKD